MKRKQLEFLGEFTEEEKKELDEWEKIYGKDDDEIEEINREYLESVDNDD